MRLAVVGPVYPYRGGIAHYTTLLAHALRAGKHTVDLYSFKRQYPRWLFPGRTDRDPSLLKLDASCEYTLDSLNPLTWWKTARVILARRPDALILQWWVPFFALVWSVLAWSARKAGIRVIFICHNVLAHEQRPWNTWVARWTLGFGHGFVVQSQAEQAQLLRILPGRPIQIVPHPIYDMFVEQTMPQDVARRQLGLSLDAPVLLFFGFVREYKGLRYLLDAMPAIRSELPNVRLLVVGEFWQDKQSYLDQIVRLGVEQSVVVADRYVPNEQVPLYFSAADVVVLPYTNVTQSGVVQLAFGFGMPVITTRVGGLSEVVADGQTGLLVPPQDAAALARAVCRFFADGLGPALATRIRAGQARTNWQGLANVLEQLAS